MRACSPAILCGSGSWVAAGVASAVPATELERGGGRGLSHDPVDIPRRMNGSRSTGGAPSGSGGRCLLCRAWKRQARADAAPTRACGSPNVVVLFNRRGKWRHSCAARAGRAAAWRRRGSCGTDVVWGRDVQDGLAAANFAANHAITHESRTPHAVAPTHLAFLTLLTADTYSRRAVWRHGGGGRTGVPTTLQRPPLPRQEAGTPDRGRTLSG